MKASTLLRLCFGLFVAAVFFRIWGEVTLHRLGRELARLQREREEIQHRLEILEAERASLTSRKRLQALGEQLGMSFPREDEIRLILVPGDSVGKKDQ